jgi:hypothetical protein
MRAVRPVRADQQGGPGDPHESPAVEGFSPQTPEALSILWVSSQPSAIPGIVLFLGLVLFLDLSWAATASAKTPSRFRASAWKLRRINDFAGRAPG